MIDIVGTQNGEEKPMNDGLSQTPPPSGKKDENRVGTLAGQGGKDLYSSKTLYD